MINSHLGVIGLKYSTIGFIANNKMVTERFVRIVE